MLLMEEGTLEKGDGHNFTAKATSRGMAISTDPDL